MRHLSRVGLGKVLLVPVLLTAVACGGGGEAGEGGDATTTTEAAVAEYPADSIEFATASGPGGGSDAMLRALLETAEIPVSTYVVNRTGGGGSNLANYVQSRPADGYTVVAVTSSNVLGDLTETMDVELLEDWRPVIRLMIDPAVLVVRPDAPWDTMDELVEALQAGEVNFGGSSVGTTTHISYIILAELTDSPTDNYVAFDASGDALPSLLGGHFDAMYAETSEVADFVASGELKALAVEGNVAGFEDVPTFEETGYQESVIVKWRGLMVRADTPEDVVTYLHDQFKAAVEESDSIWQDYLNGGGSLPGYQGPDDFRDSIAAQLETIGDVLREFGIIE